ncbi:hc-toxin efflux carrier toxa [Fusarium langsethiae]|uniref:Hc-toxin efflux carrier toxa n=1 Tax=Fusarium langsethiae TaxID=179993 RepID=A0A0M9EMS1_FUSLA|nr:hc-toxin efflux carrier toxa [Fusarium langsethiae]GKU08151.1 unnamed protein product [Fusarium langsethiae]GKU09385.1 unnamed protein product [Fusarium langsethiae]
MKHNENSVPTEKRNPIADFEAAVHQDTADTQTQQEDNGYLHGLPLILMTLSLMVGVLMISLDNSIIATAIPNITSKFDSLDDVAWYASAYLLTQLSAQPTVDKIYTFWNLKWVYLTSSIIFEAGSILCAAAPSSSVFIIGRAIAGLGAAGVFCGAMIIISRIVEMRKRPFLLAIVSSMYGISSVIGPSFGGVFTHSKQLTWRFCFWTNLPLGALMAAIIVFYYPLSLGEAPDKDKSVREKILGLGLKSAVLLAGTLICLFLALQNGGSVYPWSDSRVWGCFVGFGLLLIIFTYIQIRQSEAALIKPRIISQLSVLLGCMFSAFYQGAMTTQTDKHPTAWSHNRRRDSDYWLRYHMAWGTPLAQWFGFEVLAGAGFGIAIQIPIFAVQVVLRSADIPLGTVLVIISQVLGGSVGLSISQNVFQNSLRQRLEGISEIDVEVVIAAGGIDLEHIVTGEKLSYVRDAFRYGVSNAFVVSTSLAGVAFLASIGMQRLKIKSKKERGI